MVIVFSAWSGIVTHDDGETEKNCPSPVFNFAAFLAITSLISLVCELCAQGKSQSG